MSSAVCRQFCSNTLTHWGRNQMATILQTTSSNLFSHIKISVFWLTVYSNTFLKIQLPISHHRSYSLLCDKNATSYGSIDRYEKLRVAFSPPSRVSDPNMHHGKCVTHVPWCMLGSLTSGFLRSRWRGKRSRHSQRMRNSQLYVSGKRPIIWIIWTNGGLDFWRIYASLGLQYLTETAACSHDAFWQDLRPYCSQVDLQNQIVHIH